MSHHRHVIREALVAALKAANTAAGQRVYDNPTQPRVGWPAISVFDESEDQQAATMPGGSARTVRRSFVLQAHAEVQAVAAYARQRDQLCADIEAVAATLQVAGVKSIEPAGWAPDLSAESDRPIAIGRQRLLVTYLTPQGNPATTY